MKWKFVLIVLSLFCIASLYGNKSEATTVLEVDLEKVAANSELIFQGRVISKETRDSSTGKPFTYFKFKIDDIIKGTYADKVIELGFMGGPQGDFTLTVSDMRMPEVGENGIYFVESLSKQQVNPLYGWHQGHYLILPENPCGVEKVTPVTQSKSALTFAPTLKDFKRNLKNILGGANEN